MLGIEGLANIHLTLAASREMQQVQAKMPTYCVNRVGSVSPDQRAHSNQQLRREFLDTGKRILKHAFRQMGYEISRYTPSVSPTSQIVSSLQSFEIDLLFDIGANQGQFASDIRSGGEVVPGIRTVC